MVKGTKGVTAFSNAGQLGQGGRSYNSYSSLGTPSIQSSTSPKSSNNNNNNNNKSKGNEKQLSPEIIADLIRRELTRFLGFESEEVVQYVLNISNEKDLREYLLGGLLTAGDPEMEAFVNTLCKSKFSSSSSPSSSSTAAASGTNNKKSTPPSPPPGFFVLKKEEETEFLKPSFKSSKQVTQQQSSEPATANQSSNVTSTAVSSSSPSTSTSSRPSVGSANNKPLDTYNNKNINNNKTAADNNENDNNNNNDNDSNDDNDDSNDNIHEGIVSQQMKEIQKLRSKRKYVNLFSAEGAEKLNFKVLGRCECNCLASKHPLVNNCLECGRIVCEQERPGPCFTCGAIVFSKEQLEVVLRDSKKGAKEKEKLLKQFVEEEQQYKKQQQRLQAEIDKQKQQQVFAEGTELKLSRKADGDNEDSSLKAGYEKALQHKNKLLEFDKTSAKRTRVIDDESDYFASDNNRWLTQAQRDALREKEQELRTQKEEAKKKMTLDLTTRQVVFGENKDSKLTGVYDESAEQIAETLLKQFEKLSVGNSSIDSYISPPTASPSSQLPKPVFVDVSKSASTSSSSSSSSTAVTTSLPRRIKIQDKALQEMSDPGMCLSMHQPWASLLVLGIKKAEGRTWFSSHRGRLWIASAALEPTLEDIEQVENMYKKIYKGNVKFPAEYPTGCLLGCIDVTDCLSQEEYAAKHTDEDNESVSPYVFICENPQSLIVKFPIKGDHKIWKLDKQIHQLAKAGLKFK